MKTYLIRIHWVQHDGQQRTWTQTVYNLDRARAKARRFKTNATVVAKVERRRIYRITDNDELVRETLR